MRIQMFRKRPWPGAVCAALFAFFFVAPPLFAASAFTTPHFSALSDELVRMGEAADSFITVVLSEQPPPPAQTPPQRIIWKYRDEKTFQLVSFESPLLYEELLDPRSMGMKSYAIGTGWMCGAQGTFGLICTKHHVVKGGIAIRVLINGREHDGTVIEFDVKEDMAVIKIEKVDAAEVFQVAPIGDSDTIKSGELVVNVGTPFGFAYSRGVGVIAARRVFDSLPHLQLDMNVRPGQSGSPLLNKNLEVMGTIKMLYRNEYGDKVAFAVPVNRFKPLLARAVAKIRP